MKKELTGEDEDLIHKNLIFLLELEKVKETYFQTLVEELGLNLMGACLLEDFLFPRHEEEEHVEDFSVYLEERNIDQSKLFKK